jgi:hypothetical protein
LFGYRTNIREVINAIFHFVAAFKIFANHNKAESFAKESDLEGQSGGARDAYRHIVWSALNTRDVGEKTTKKFTDAHEASTEQNSSDRAMDIYNNEIGREIGNIPNITDDEIKVKAHEAVKAAEIPKEGVKAAAVKPLPSINGPYEYGKGVEDVK